VPTGARVLCIFQDEPEATPHAYLLPRANHARLSLGHTFSRFLLTAATKAHRPLKLAATHANR